MRYEGKDLIEVWSVCSISWCFYIATGCARRAGVPFSNYVWVTFNDVNRKLMVGTGSESDTNSKAE